MPNSHFTCGLDAALAVVGGKWKPLVLYFLAHEPRRYGDLKRCLRDVSDKVLVQQLKQLEADGIVLRRDFHEIPPKVDYSLTELGRSLARTLRALCEWGEAHADEATAAVARRADIAQHAGPDG